MKKRYFKKWIDYSLIIITVMLFIIIASLEHESIIIDSLIKITSLLLIIINSKLLKKYSKIMK